MFSFAPQLVMELGYPLKIWSAFCCHFGVFLQKVSCRTKNVVSILWSVISWTPCTVFIILWFVQYFSEFKMNFLDFSLSSYQLHLLLIIPFAIPSKIALIFSLQMLYLPLASLRSTFFWAFLLMLLFFSRIDLILFFEKLLVNLQMSYFKNSHMAIRVLIEWTNNSFIFFFIFSTYSLSWIREQLNFQKFFSKLAWESFC